MTSQEAMEAECLHQFGVVPRTSDSRESYIKMTWIRNVKEGLILNDRVAMKKYVKCHILLLFGSILFADKSGSAVHWKFLPLLRDFSRIHEISWGSTSLAHLYKALYRASRFDCKEIDGPLKLLHIWAWICMPFLAPISRTSRFFPLANQWRNWEHHNWPYRYHTVAYFRGLLDEVQEGQFVWEAYGVDRIEADVIPEDIYSQSESGVQRCRRSFGFVQGVPHQERSLDGQHGEILTGSKNLDGLSHTDFG
nr:serine/threonine-protein phosphatase 7 long form homolog [Arachis hypogaea]